MDRERVIQDRAAASAADFWENGPRLSGNRKSYILARATVVADGKEVEMVLRGGLGAMGIGRMWGEAGGSITDETYADAPVNPDAFDSFGQTAQTEADQHAAYLKERGE